MKDMKRALIVLTNISSMGASGKPTGFWLPELTHPYFALVDKGIEVDVVSIEGGSAPMDKNSQSTDDTSVQRFLDDDDLMSLIKDTRSLAAADASLYDAIVFAGGHGAMWDFPSAQAVQDKACEIYENNGIVGAICHGPAALIELKLSNGEYLVKGKKVAAFTNEEEWAVELTDIVPFSLSDRLVRAGANHVIAPPWSENVEIDGRLITGQNPQSAQLFSEALTQALLQGSDSR